MVLIKIDVSALPIQQRIDYADELDRNLGVANLRTDNPLYIDLYTDHPDLLFFLLV